MVWKIPEGSVQPYLSCASGKKCTFPQINKFPSLSSESNSQTSEPSSKLASVFASLKNELSSVYMSYVHVRLWVKEEDGIRVEVNRS